MNKYIKIFEDFNNFDWKNLDEEVEDMVITLKENGENITDLKPFHPSNILADLCISDQYSDIVRTYRSNPGTIHNKELLNYSNRICRYLSGKKDLKVIPLSTSGYNSLVFGDPKTIYYIDKVYKLENRYDDGYDLDPTDISDDSLQNKMSLLYENGYNFTVKSGGYSIDGFTVNVYQYSSTVPIIVFSFVRDPNIISDQIDYSVDIETFPKSNSINRKIKLLNASKLSVDIYDNSNPKEFYEILISMSISFLGIKKIILINDILDRLNQNDFFTIDEVESHKDTIVVSTSDKDIVVNIDDDLNIYIGDKIDKNKTELEDLVYDIFLKLTDKNA